MALDHREVRSYIMSVKEKMVFKASMERTNNSSDKGSPCCKPGAW
jgi:hypothetical protein